MEQAIKKPNAWRMSTLSLPVDEASETSADQYFRNKHKASEKVSRIQVIQFLREEACRDVPDDERADMTQMMRYVADYLERQHG